MGNSKDVTLAGLAVAISFKNTQRGRMGFVTLDDKTARMEVSLYAEVLDQCQEMLEKDTVLIIKGKMSKNSYTDEIRIAGNEVYNIETIRQQLARRLHIVIQASQMTPAFLAELKRVLSPKTEANCMVNIQYQSDKGCVDLVSSGHLRIMPNAKLLEDLRLLIGEDNFTLYY